MSSSASYSVAAAAAAASGLPVKRHRNTFLLPLQQQHQEQNRLPVAEEEALGLANAAPPQQQRSNNSSNEDSNNDDDQAAAIAAAENDRLDAGPLALVILNAQGEGESEGLLRHLWGRADLRVCADGGANRLHDSFGGGGGGGGGDVEDRHQDRACFVPDIIVGDLDSLRPEVARFYEGLGSEIKLRDDQDHCDFEKCLVEVESRLSSPPPSAAAGGSGGGSGPCGATVVGLGAFGGRFDHEMQAVSLLHAYTSRFHRLVLMGAGNVAFLLQPGLSHAVQPDSRFEGPTVGLLPVGGPCRAVTTEGLRWNLDGGGLEFGVCVSSSNRVVGDVVRVVTDAPLVWTAEFKAAAWMEAVSFAEGD
ncbi:unnamed protein product [Ectocarpus sp. 6 AP-2014]